MRNNLKILTTYLFLIPLFFLASFQSKASLVLNTYKFYEGVSSVQNPKHKEESKYIAIFSSSPATNGVDTTGGWGDVMANVNSALELHKRGKKVTLFVLSDQGNSTTGKDSPAEIVATVLPELNPNNKDLLQKTKQGLNVVFLSNITDKYLTTNFDIHKINWSEYEKIENLMVLANENKLVDPNTGRFNLALIFSKNTASLVSYSAPIAPIALTLLELDESPKKELSNHLTLYERSGVDKSFWNNHTEEKSSLSLHLTTGFQTTGYYASYSNRSREQSLAQLNPWIQNHYNFDVKVNDQIALAFTKDLEMTDVYLQALSAASKRLNLESKVKVFVKKQKGIETLSLPTNLDIVILEHNIPLRLMTDLVNITTLAPILNGDNLFSEALNVLKKGQDRFIVYDEQGWKRALVDNLFDAMKIPTQLRGPEQAGALRASQILYQNQIMYQNREEYIDRLTDYIVNKDLQKKLVTSFLAKKKEFDIYENIEKIYKLLLPLSVLNGNHKFIWYKEYEKDFRKLLANGRHFDFAHLKKQADSFLTELRSDSKVYYIDTIESFLPKYLTYVFYNAFSQKELAEATELLFKEIENHAYDQRKKYHSYLMDALVSGFPYLEKLQILLKNNSKMRNSFIAITEDMYLNEGNEKDQSWFKKSKFYLRTNQWSKPSIGSVSCKSLL